MLTRQFRCLVALDSARSIDVASAACGLSRQELLAVLSEAERTFGKPLVRLSEAFDGFTPLGEIVLTSARKLVEAEGDEPPSPLVPIQDKLTTVLSRRSVSPKRLGAPGPTAEELDLIVQAALRAPDHGSLHPWRVIEFPSDARPGLADLFEQEKRRRDPLTSEVDAGRAREHATRVPMLLAFVVSPKPRSTVPVQEQWLAAGAALGNLLNAAHQLGFGAIMLSGERCYDTSLATQLGVSSDEVLAGFISMGRIVEVPPARKPMTSGEVLSRWSPSHEVADESRHGSSSGVAPR